MKERKREKGHFWVVPVTSTHLRGSIYEVAVMMSKSGEKNGWNMMGVLWQDKSVFIQVQKRLLLFQRRRYNKITKYGFEWLRTKVCWNGKFLHWTFQTFFSTSKKRKLVPSSIKAGKETSQLSTTSLCIRDPYLDFDVTGRKAKKWHGIGHIIFVLLLLKWQYECTSVRVFSLEDAQLTNSKTCIALFHICERMKNPIYLTYTHTTCCIHR
jgi:hypothetical protein